MSTKIKKDIQYSEKDALTHEDWSDQQIRISMMIPVELLDALKDRAAAEGKKYQPFMREILQLYVEGRLHQKNVDLYRVADFLANNEQFIVLVESKIRKDIENMFMTKTKNFVYDTLKKLKLKRA